MSEIRTVDLFCGCGGLSLGFMQCGYEIVGAFDFWQPAIECYSINFEHKAEKLDLSKKNTALKSIRPLAPQIIIGGPPCQDFSSAGGRTEGDRANLTISFAKIAKSIKPKYFVMENVSRAIHSTAYKEARVLFKAAGYGLTEQVLDSSKCGVPQKRKRFFCIGALGETDGFLDDYLLANQSVLPLTMRDYYDKNHYALSFDFYYRHPRSYSRRAVFSVDEPAATVRGVNRPMPPEYSHHIKDAATPDGVTSLSYRQRARLQTLPDSFVFPENQAIAEQLIGNAVPVNLAMHVAKALLAFEKKDTTYRRMDFSLWLQTNHNYSSLAAKDVVSRLNRCNRIVSISSCSLQDYCSLIDNGDNFKEIPCSVRSQLKRAVTLYYEYDIWSSR